jgi:cob(I)alamin adenosyltransferase
MKIYTKKGDTGTTQLIGGTRVQKHHIRIEAYGTVDELNSNIGLLADLLNDLKEEKKMLRVIQDKLFTLGSLLAADPEKNKMKLPTIKSTDVEALENAIDAMDEQLPAMTHFVLPGGHQAVSQAHISRCVCRRAERMITHLNEIAEVDAIIIQYLNRLSDYLFTLSRFIAKHFNAEEIKWIPTLAD